MKFLFQEFDPDAFLQKAEAVPDVQAAPQVVSQAAPTASSAEQIPSVQSETFDPDQFIKNEVNVFGLCFLLLFQFFFETYLHIHSFFNFNCVAKTL